MRRVVPLFHAHTLPAGVRVRVRLPHRDDVSGLIALHERSGHAISEMDARRLLRFDPRERATVCATTWVGGADVLVGFAAASPGDGTPTFLADEELAPGLGDVLCAALRERLARVA